MWSQLYSNMILHVLSILNSSYIFVVNRDDMTSDTFNGGGSSYDSEICEIHYSAPFTDEDYQNFRHQQGLFVELKDFPAYLGTQILGSDKISIELSSIDESSTNKQARRIWIHRNQLYSKFEKYTMAKDD